MNYDFNPRSRIGFDMYVYSHNLFLRKFQSTKPYRLRPRTTILPFQIRQFQSTKPYRLRLFAHIKQRSVDRFQSTKPYRLRPDVRFARLAAWEFQSTKPYRLRPCSPIAICSSTKNFNPRSRIGFDHKALFNQLSNRISIHEAV